MPKEVYFKEQSCKQAILRNLIMIQMTDLKAQYDSIKVHIDTALREVFDDCLFVMGKQIDLFEEAICKYLKVRYAVGVASGTDALVLALCALGIETGDEVITTPFTFIATAEAISRVGAKPVFCDIGEDYNIDTEKIEGKITPKTKAILPVHLYGLPCDMDKLIAIASRYNLKVIEDCAQSFGAEYKGKKVGSMGHCGALSFFPAKNLGCCGDGGMVVTNSEDIAKKLSMLRNHGSSDKYRYSIHGFNSRLDTLQAAVLNVKLKYIDGWVNKRIENARTYDRLLGSFPGILLPKVPARLKHSFNYYTIRVMSGRDDLQAKLRKEGITSAVYYPLSLHLQKVFVDLKYKPGDFPEAERAQSQVLSLPMYPELTDNQMSSIAQSIIS